jgi:hypothetical protein
VKSEVVKAAVYDHGLSVDISYITRHNSFTCRISLQYGLHLQGSDSLPSIDPACVNMGTAILVEESSVGVDDDDNDRCSN